MSHEAPGYLFQYQVPPKSPPFSIIFDFMLIKLFGLNYVLFFSPALTILSVIQVLILRRINFKFSKGIFFYKKLENNYFFKLFLSFQET